MEARDENRMFGIGGIVFVWGMVGIVLLLQAAKGYYTGQTPEIRTIIGVILATVTVLCTVLGDKTRRAIGTIWIAITAVGLLFLVVGAGLDIYWMGELSMGMVFTGLFTSSLIFLPDRN
jgi:hypothetical protein